MRSVADGAGFLQFLLVVSGVACLIAGISNMPRHAEKAQLEVRCARLGAALTHTYAETAGYRRRQIALQNDPHYREFAIRWTLRHRLPGEMTVEEYVRGQRRLTVARAP